MAVRCVRCATELRALEARPGVSVQFCDGCRAMLCSQDVVGVLLDVGSSHQELEEFWRRARPVHRECVACEGPMKEASFPGEPPLFSCERCGNVWLDPGVLAPLKRHLVHATRPRNVVPKDLPEDMEEPPPSSSPVGESRFAYDTPWVNGLAFPGALMLAVLLNVTRLWPTFFLLVQTSFHELGHAVVAWLSGRPAMPVFIGFTSVRNERYTVVIVLVLGLLVGGVVRGAMTKRWGMVVVASGLLVGQVLLTFVLSPTESMGWVVFGGCAGEFVVPALGMAMFYGRWEDRLRWDFWRYLLLVPSASAFVCAFRLWLRIDRFEQALPRGAFLTSAKDANGDVDRLIGQYGWTPWSLSGAYVTLGVVCGVVLAIEYGVFLVVAFRKHGLMERFREHCEGLWRRR